MDCKILFDKDNNRVGVLDENGKRDTLFDQIYSNPQITDFDEALNIYLETLSPKLERIADKLPLTLPVFDLKQFAEILKKEKPVEIVTDENGFDWYEAPITQKDAQTPVIAFSIDENRVNTLKYTTPKGEVFTSYSQALKNTNDGLIEVGLNTIEGLKTLYTINSSTNIKSINGLINNLIKSGLLSDKSYIDSKGRKLITPAGNSKVKRIINSEIAKKQAKESFGRIVKTLSNGDMYFDTTELPKTEDFVGELAVQAVKEATPTQTAVEDTIKIVPENELQLNILSLLKKMGIRTLNLADYVEKYSKKNGVPPSAQALADLTEKIIAFKDGIVEAQDLNEETAHFIVATTPKEDIVNLLRNVHKTKQWAQHSKTYFEIYKNEDLVREEILGKVLAEFIQNKFDANTAENETERSILNRLKDIFNNFFTKIQNYFKSEYQTELDGYMNSIYSNLMQDTLFNKLDLTKLENRQIALFSVDTSKRTPITEVYKKSAEILDMVYKQQKQLTKGKGQTSVNIRKIKDLSEKEDAYSKIKALSAITAIAKKQVEQLDRAIHSKKEDEFPFTHEENAVYEVYKGVISQLLLEVKSLLTTADLTPLSKQEQDSIIKDQKTIAEEITTTLSKFSEIEGKLGVYKNNAIQVLTNNTAIKHNLSDKQREYLEKAIVATQKDTAVMHAYLGSLVHARSPLLNLAGDVIANTTSEPRQSFLNTIKPFVQTLEESEYTPKMLKEFINGSYLKNDIDNMKLDAFEKEVKLRVYNSIATEQVTEYVDGLEDSFDAEQLSAFNKDFKDIMSEVKEGFFTDEYLKTQEKQFSVVYPKALAFHKRDRAERSEVRARATKNGLTIYDKNDREELEEINRTRSEASSFYTPDGELKQGIVSTYNKETGKYEYTLEDDASDEAEIAYGLKQISDIISNSFEKGETKEIPRKFFELWDSYETVEEKTDFLFLNAYVGFNDSFWENFGANKSALQKLEEAKNGENDAEIDDLIKGINTNQQKIRYIQKNNRVYNRPTETDVANMHSSEKAVVKEAVQDLSALFSKANKFLKTEFQVDSENLFVSAVNDSFLEDLEDSGITALNDKIEFIQKHTTYQGKRDIEKALTLVENIKKDKVSEVPYTMQRFISLDMKGETLDNALLKFAESKLLPYYKRTEPIGFTELLQDLKNGSIGLEEFSNSPLVQVSPNFSFYENAVNENVNPEFLKNKEIGRLQIKKGDIKLKHKLFKGDVYNFDDESFLTMFDDNPNKKKVYDALLKVQKKTLEDCGIADSHNLYLLPQVGKRGLRQKQDLIQKWSDPKVWKEAIEDTVNFRQDEAEFGQDLEGNPAERRLNAHIIPMYYTKKLENQDDVSDELLYSYALMSQQAALYRARVDNIGDMLSIKKAILDTSFEGKSAEASNTYKMYQSFLDYNFYGIKENLSYSIDVGFTKVDVAKVLRGFIKYSSFVNLSGVVVPFTNVLQSTVNKTVETIVGERVNPLASRLGNKEFLKLAPASMGEMLQINSKSTLNLILEFFGQSELVSGRFANSNYNKSTRGLGKLAHATHEMASFPTIPRTVLAVLMDNRYFKKDENSSGKIYSYNQFKDYQKATGVTDLKDIELKWKSLDLFYKDILTNKNQLEFNKKDIGIKLGLEGEELETYFNQFILGVTSRIKIAVQDVDMAIPQEEKSMMARHSLSNLILQHSGWLLLASQKKFKEKHLNLATGLIEEGNWQTLGRFIKDITFGYRKANGANYLQHVKNMWNGDNLKDAKGEINVAELESQRRNLVRAGVEVAVVNALFLMGYLLANMRSDDDEEKDFFDEAIDIAYYFTYRTGNEIASSTIALPIQYVGKVKSPVVSLQMMGEMGKFYNLFNGDIVKRGRYAGETQSWRTINKLVPFFKDYTRLTNMRQEADIYKHFNEDSETFISLSWVLNPDEGK